MSDSVIWPTDHFPDTGSGKMNMGDLEHFRDTLYSFVKDQWYGKVVGINGVSGDQLNAFVHVQTFRLASSIVYMQKLWADDVRTSLYTLGPEIMHLISFLESSSGFPCL